LEHCRRAAREHDDVLAGFQKIVEQVGDVALVAGGAVVGRELGGGEEARSLRVLLGAKAEQRLAATAILEHRKWRDPDAAADEDRLDPGRRRSEALPERTHEVHVLTNPEAAQAMRPGPDVLEQEPDLPISRIKHRDRARQIRTLINTPAPPRNRSQHVELPRLRDSSLFADPKHDIPPHQPPAQDRGDAATKRSRHLPVPSTT